MEWYAYYYDINRNKIDKFNVFDHCTFREYAKKAAKKYKTKEEFTEQLKRELQFYFWSKCEWELVIKIAEDNRIFLIPWVGCRNPEEVKIEILPIVTEEGFNWEVFAKEHIMNQRYYNKAKIDVYDQVMFEWDKFAEYCWNNKKKLLKME